MPHARAVDWVLLDPTAKVAIGDVVSAEPGGMPIYRVTDVAADAVWLEDDRHHAPVPFTSLEAFRWKGALV